MSRAHLLAAVFAAVTMGAASAPAVGGQPRAGTSAGPGGAGAACPVLSVTQFGAVDDDATDNTDAFTRAIAAAGPGRTLLVPAPRTGVYRVSPRLDFRSADLQLEEGVQLKGLDGAPYTGFYAGAVGLHQTLAPGAGAAGKRIETPGSSTAVVSSIDAQNGYTHQFINLYQGRVKQTVSAYTTNGVVRGVGLLGQSAPSSGGFGVLVGQINNYQHTNGAGVTLTGTLTKGSRVITEIASTAGVFDPAQVTSDAAGFPPQAFVADGGVGPDTLTLNAPYTGETRRNARVTVTSGFSELTPIALGAFDVDGGPNRRALARYFDYDISTNVSSDPADQERFLSGSTKFVVKYVPGNVNDKIRRGSGGDHVITRPGGEGFNDQDRSHTRSYPLSVGRLTWGYSGDPSRVTSGAQPAATPGFLVGDQIGGPGMSVWDREYQRSYLLVGAQIEDYEQDAIVIKQPRTAGDRFTGRAITVARGAGDIRSGDHFASNGSAPRFAAQTTTGHTLSAGATDAHFTVTSPRGSHGFRLTWAKPYADTPDVVCGSPTGTTFKYTASAAGISVAYDELNSEMKLSCIAMGL